MVPQMGPALPELLWFLSFPWPLGRKRRTPNVIERCFVEVRRRTRPLVCFVNVRSVARVRHIDRGHERIEEKLGSVQAGFCFLRALARSNPGHPRPATAKEAVAALERASQPEIRTPA